jgi:hypothetical protein
MKVLCVNFLQYGAQTYEAEVKLAPINIEL